MESLLDEGRNDPRAVALKFLMYVRNPGVLRISEVGPRCLYFKQEPQIILMQVFTDHI